MSQAPPPPSPNSRSRAQEARQPHHRLVQQLSTATCTWSVQHAIFIFFCFESSSLHSALPFLLCTGNQAAQSCRLRVEQDWTQTSTSSWIRQHLYHKVGQPGLSHRASHCTIYTFCKYYAVVFVFCFFMKAHFLYLNVSICVRRQLQLQIHRRATIFPQLSRPPRAWGKLPKP